jgi:hypothetical protein
VVDSEKTVIRNIPIDAINEDLSTFRNLSTARSSKGIDAYERHATITTPHAVVLFDNGDYKIAEGALTTHPILIKAENLGRAFNGKPKSTRMASGHAFTLKETPDSELIRLDVLGEDLNDNLRGVVEQLIEKGYTIYDAAFHQLSTEPEILEQAG